MSKPDYDVIVIGAGHNGLIAAAYLAKAGKRVVVLEAYPTPGGMLGTNVIFASAPKHLINEGGIRASMLRSTTIEKDLDPAAMRMWPAASGQRDRQLSHPGGRTVLSGAGTHPTGGISGIPGQQSAKWLLKKMK